MLSWNRRHARSKSELHHPLKSPVCACVFDHVALSILNNFFTLVVYVGGVSARPLYPLGPALSLQPCNPATLQYCNIAVLLIALLESLSFFATREALLPYKRFLSLGQSGFLAKGFSAPVVFPTWTLFRPRLRP